MALNKDSGAADPRGLIFESYRIDGIDLAQCRTIFLDWALGQPLGTDVTADLEELLARYSEQHPDHPMTAVLREGLAKAREPRRRGGARARR